MTLYTYAEAERLYSISTRALQRLVKAGKITAYKPGAKVLLAHCQGVTVPELVRKIKGDMLADGADPGIEPVSTFFESLDAAAALHIN